MKKNYKDMLKIKHDVIIGVFERSNRDILRRLRILRPDGTCTWAPMSPAFIVPGDRMDHRLQQEYSCFYYNINDLYDTVESMEDYDQHMGLTSIIFGELKDEETN